MGAPFTHENPEPDGMPVGAAVFQTQGLHKVYMVGGGQVHALRDVNMELFGGQLDDWFGLNAYMHRRELNRLMREADHVSGAYMLVDSDQLERLYGELHETPVVGSVLIRQAVYDNFLETMVETQRIVQSVNIIFAVIIAFGVVYNTARISLAERTRELATLRVLGFTRHEISSILLSELAVLTLIALPVGALLSGLLVRRRIDRLDLIGVLKARE